MNGRWTRVQFPAAPQKKTPRMFGGVFCFEAICQTPNAAG